MTDLYLARTVAEKNAAAYFDRTLGNIFTSVKNFDFHRELYTKGYNLNI